MNNMKYDAFISYRHLPSDKAVAMQLQKLLEGYKPPKSGTYTNTGKITRLFRDESELPTSNDLSSDIRAALEQSRYLIVICSPALKESKWCLQEIELFKELHNGRTNNILPLLIDGNPSEVFPDALRYDMKTITLEDGSLQSVSVEVEPLASNIIANNLDESLKKLKVEFLRIAAPLLGCSFDDLYGRHQRRAKQQIMAAAALFIAVAGIFVGSVLYQNSIIQKERDNAVFNETRAIAGEAEANEQRLIAEANEALAKQERDKALRSQSMFLSGLSLEQTSMGDTNAAIMLALEALPANLTNPERPYVHAAERALRQAMTPPGGSGFVAVSGSNIGNLKQNTSGLGRSAGTFFSARGHVLMPNDQNMYESWMYDMYTGRCIFQSIDQDINERWSFNFSPDGDYYAYCTSDGYLQLVCYDGREWSYKLDEETDTGNIAYFAPDMDNGVRIALKWSEKLELYRLDEKLNDLIRVWENTDTYTGEYYDSEYSLHLTEVAWSPDGKKILAQYVNSNWILREKVTKSMYIFVILDASTGRVLTWFDDNGAINATRGGWSPDGRVMYTFSENGLQFMDAESYTPLPFDNEDAATFMYVHGDTVIFSPDSSMVAILFKDGKMRIYRMSDMLLLDSVATTPDGSFDNFSWSSDSTMIMFFSRGRNLVSHPPRYPAMWFVYNVTKKTKINLPDSTGKQLTNALFLPGSNDIAVIQYDGDSDISESTSELEFRIWRLADNHYPAPLTYEGTDRTRSVLDMTWSDDGRYLKLRGAETVHNSDSTYTPYREACVLIDTTTMQKVNEPPSGMTALEYSKSGRYVLVQHDMRYGVYDAHTENIAYFAMPGFWKEKSTYQFIYEMSFSPDETKVQYKFGIFDVVYGDLLYELDSWIGDRIIENVVFTWSNNSGMFVYGANLYIETNKHVKNVGLYDAYTFEQIRCFRDIDIFATGFLFSPDDSLLFYYTVDVGIYDIKKDESIMDMIHRESGYFGMQKAFAWSPDGKQFVMNNNHYKLAVYDTSTWETLYVYYGNQGMYALPPDFSPDGDMFITPDGSIYRTSDGVEIVSGRNLMLKYSVNENYAAAFSPDGKRYAIWHGDSINIYDLKPLTELIDEAKTLLNGRVFTQAEREKYFLE